MDLFDEARLQVPHSGNRCPILSRLPTAFSLFRRLRCRALLLLLPLGAGHAELASQQLPERLHGGALKDQLREWVLAQPRLPPPAG